MVSPVLLKKMVKKALDIVGTDPSGLQILVTYTQLTPGLYDPATDTMGGITTAYTSVPAMLVATKDEERDWINADVNSQKALIAYENLPIVPEQQDYLTIDGDRWEIKKMKMLPGTPVHILYIQRA
jgi:hypothetical protein